MTPRKHYGQLIFGAGISAIVCLSSLTGTIRAFAAGNRLDTSPSGLFGSVIGLGLFTMFFVVGATYLKELFRRADRPDHPERSGE